MAIGLPAYHQEKRKHGMANKAACEEAVRAALNELPWIEIGYIKDALLETRGNKLHSSKLLGITRQGLNTKNQPLQNQQYIKR